MAGERRVASVFFPSFKMDLVHRGRRVERPSIVVGRRGNAFIVADANEPAAAARIVPPMSLTEARAICPQVAVHREDIDLEEDMLRNIAHDCERFTPLIGLDPPHGLFLDIEGCAHLHGGEAPLLSAIAERMARWGFAARIGFADTASVAWGLARYGEGGIAPKGSGWTPLKPLPPAALRLGEETLSVLDRLGLKTVEAVFAYPRASLVRRFGKEIAFRFDQIFAHIGEPISPISIPMPFVSERRFAEPVVSLEGIELCLRQLAGTLCDSLRKKGEGARQLAVRMFHSDGVVRGTEVGSSEPLADPARIMALLSPRLEALSARIETDSGVDILRLGAVETGRLDPAQADFCAPDQSLASLAELIDTLSERLGTDAVRQVVPVDTHIPHEAESFRPAQETGGRVLPAQFPLAPAAATRRHGARPSRPITLFSPPEPIETLAAIPDGPPVRFKWRRVSYQVVAAEGPERIAQKWWEHEAAPTFDYYAVEDETGCRFWIYREGLYGRETNEPRWFMHGLFP